MATFIQIWPSLEKNEDVLPAKLGTEGFQIRF